MGTQAVLTRSTDRSLSQEKIYVVDDDPLVLSAIKDALIYRGYKPAVFSSGADLLASIDPNESGCVVTDLKMPGVDGVSIQRALIEQDSSLSLIVLTGHADVPVTVELMMNGAITLIEKPFKVEHLSDEVGRALEVSSQRHAEKLRLKNAREAIAKLTGEEIAVMDCAVQGKSNKVTGSELSLSSRTVDRRRQSALQKIDAGSISQYAVIRSLTRDDSVPEGDSR